MVKYVQTMPIGQPISFCWWILMVKQYNQGFSDLLWNTLKYCKHHFYFSRVFWSVYWGYSWVQQWWRRCGFYPTTQEKAKPFDRLWMALTTFELFSIFFFVFRSNDIKRLMLWRCTFFQRFQNHQKKNVEDPKSFCHNLSKQLISWCVLAICRNKLTFAPDIYRNQQNIIENHF